MGTAARDIVTIVQRAIAQSGVDMTGKPDEIPQDVIDAAADAYVAYCDEQSRLTQAPTEDELLNVAARAIMAERERCAKVVEEQGKVYGDSDGELYVILVAAEIRK